MFVSNRLALEAILSTAAETKKDNDFADIVNFLNHSSKLFYLLHKVYGNGDYKLFSRIRKIICISKFAINLRAFD